MHRMPRPLVMTLFLLLLVPGTATSARAGEARIFLSWGAANDLPGATSRLARTCGDTSRVDTLYLSFEPGRACSTFVGITANLWFSSMDGDSLGAEWQAGEARALPRGMKLEFGRDLASGYPFPWESPGIGDYGYLRPVKTAGQLRIIYAVSSRSVARVEGGKRYGFARLLVRRPAAGAPGCEQRVCVGWTEGTLAYSTQEEVSVTEGVKYVGINAAVGEHSCDAGASPAPSGPAKGRTPKRPSGNR
jgi:hypothetical protein